MAKDERRPGRIGGYQDDEHGANVLIGNTLHIIRPEYQREFVYSDKLQQAVINSMLRQLPLNTIYFAQCEDGTREVMDGQQRLLSILSSSTTSSPYSGTGRPTTSTTCQPTSRRSSSTTNCSPSSASEPNPKNSIGSGQSTWPEWC